MNQIEKKIFCIATLIGLSAVVLGAFAAHGLQYSLSAASIKSFLTGVRYQFYHAFFLFIVGLIPSIKKYQKRIGQKSILASILASQSIPKSLQNPSKSLCKATPNEACFATLWKPPVNRRKSTGGIACKASLWLGI